MKIQNDSDDDVDYFEYRDLVWPEENSLEEVIISLRSRDIINILECFFDDDSWDTSQELQNALIADDYSPSFNLEYIIMLRVYNDCIDEENRKRCEDLFFECLQHHCNSTDYFRYMDNSLTPWTIVEANKFASIIANLTHPIETLVWLAIFSRTKAHSNASSTKFLTAGS